MSDDSPADSDGADDPYKSQLQALLAIVARFNENLDPDLIEGAFAFAAEVHRDQHRHENHEPYIVHPLAVARLAAEHQMDVVSVAAALLHDCIEDARAPLRVNEEVLTNCFGSEVARIVQGLTKLQQEESSSSNDRQLETLVKLLRASATEDVRIILIKIFDRLDNIRSLHVFGEEKRRRIAFETQKFYIPLALRLGLFAPARTMEDHIFRVLQPQIYQSIQEWLETEGRNIERKWHTVGVEICAELGKMNLSCRYRVKPKSTYVIYQGMGKGSFDPNRLREGCNYTLYFVLEDVDACFRALNLVHRRLSHLRESVKDFINSPKINGYQSLHTMCTGPALPRVQVVIRTEEMDIRSRIGVIWELQRGQRLDNSWLQELHTISKEGRQQAEVLALTSEIAYSEIEVISPKGELKKVPRGATALDYAYSIHTALGNKAVYARVNGTLQPLRTVLRPGQRIEILTSDNVRPSYERLEWVKTHRARVALRKAIHRAERQAFLTAAENFFGYCQKLLQWVPPRNSGERQQLFVALKVANEEEFGRELACGRITYDFVFLQLVPILPGQVLAALRAALTREGAGQEDLADETSLRASVAATLRQRLEESAGEQLEVTFEGFRHPLPIRRARCCRPEFGNEILALTSPDRGVFIHRANCQNVQLFKQHESPRLVSARWKKPPQQKLVRLRLRGQKRRDLLADIAQKLLPMQLDVSSLQFSAHDNRTAVAEIWVLVPDDIAVKDILARVAEIQGIEEVTSSLDAVH